MKFSSQTLACSKDLTKKLEVQRQQQFVQFRDTLTNSAEGDFEAFCSICLHVLPPQFWILVEDLERTEERIEKTHSVRLIDQLMYFRVSVVKSLISAMLYREKGESYGVKLLEVIALLDSRL